MSDEPDMNKTLATIDAVVKSHFPDPTKQLGVLIMACVLACRRLLGPLAADRGKRMKLIKTMVESFDSKLREHVKPDLQS